MKRNKYNGTCETECQKLSFDIRRTIILSEYMKHWEMPEFRQTMSRENERVELYTFPGDDSENVTRFSTIGLSSIRSRDSERQHSIGAELMMVVPKGVAIEQEDQIKNYLFDVASYLLNTLGKQLTVGTTIPESPLAPNGWPKALLFDEPRGEPEELSCFHIGSQHVDLFWLIPIYGSEHELIKEKGLDAFDKLDETEDISLVDINRPPLTTN